MTSKQPLNDRQLATLRWIGAGCPYGHWEDFSYKTTCYSLAARGLAEVDRRPSSWSATITEAGSYYLEHGRFPGATLVELQARAKASGRHRNGAVSAAEFAAAIMRELEASDSDVFEFGHDDFYFNSREVEAAAVRSPWRPVGKKFTLESAGNWQDRRYTARFVYDPAASVSRSDVSVPARVSKLHSVAVAYRDDPDRHEVTKPSLARACRVVHAIAVEAERRGYALVHASKPGRDYSEYRSSLSDGQFLIDVSGHGFALRLAEVPGKGGAPINYLQARSKPRWQSTRQTAFVATGKLSIAITGWTARSGRKEKFTDGKRQTLDSQLGELFWELEVRALERDEADKEQARAAEVRRQQREVAIAAAKVHMVEADRVSQLHARAAEWAEYQRLQDYVRAVAERVKTEQTPAADAVEWLAWIEAHLVRANPLEESPTMPTEPEPTDENMRPYLRGWPMRDL